MKLRTIQERNEIIHSVCELYGGKKIELDYTTPFQLLCAVMLSAQTTDKQVNKVTPNLFCVVQAPKDMIELSLEDVTKRISSINYYKNKAQFLLSTARILVESYGGELPKTVEEMIQLPGVGIKTAKVVLSVLHNLPLVGVDTHIHRVCNRIGLVKTTTPLQTDAYIAKKFTIEQKIAMHHPFVLFGRYTCIATKPRCATCPLASKCNYYSKQSNQSGSKSRSSSKKPRSSQKSDSNSTLSQ